MSLALRILLAVAAIAAAATSSLYQSSRARALAEVEQAFAEVAPTADVARHLDRVLDEPEPIRASVVAARELIAGIVRSLPPESTEQRLHLVAAAERARELAARALEQRPADADTAGLLGAATYLARTLDRDRRLFTESEAWEAPLELAIELAPGSHRASEFLAMAYLDVWGVLSERKRALAIELLREGFAEPDTFKRLVPAWLRLAPDLETALSVVPDDPFAWQTLTQVLAREKRLSDLVVVERLRREKLVDDIGARLDEADRRIAAKQPRDARLLHLGILREAEIDGRFSPPIERLLKSLPPGPVDATTAARLGRWLDWTLDLCLIERCPFPPEVIQRLDVLSAREADALRAAAALAAGDLVEGERLLRLQRTAAKPAGPEWGPFRILAARAYRKRGDLPAARRQLEALSADWQAHPVAVHELARLREAEPGSARRPASGAVSSTAQRWGSWQWSSDRGYSKLTVEALITGSLDLDLVFEKGGAALLALAIDGQPPSLFETATGRSLQAGLVLTPGLHLLEVSRIAGSEVRPGDLTLAP
jgi:hypothetical protein